MSAMEVADRSPTPPDGRALEAEHRDDDARVAYESRLSQTPNDAGTQLDLGRLYVQHLRDTDKAITHLEQARTIDPKLCEAHFLLSEAYTARFVKAGILDKLSWTLKIKTALDAAVECDPRSVAYREGRIQYILAVPGAGGYAGAHEEADAIAAFDPSAALLTHATLFGYEGKTDLALESFDKALSRAPEDPRAYERLGQFYSKQGRYDDAIARFERLVQLTPDSPDGHSALGRAYLKADRFDDAAKELRSAYEKSPESAMIACDLALALERMGRRGEAVEYYQRSLSADPNSPKAAVARRRLDELTGQAPQPPRGDDSVQPASLRFFLPLVFAYLLACGGWILLARWGFLSLPRMPFPTSARPWLDLGLAGVAVAAILGLGSVFRADLLLPRGPGPLSSMYWTLNNLIIFSPVFILVAARRQRLESVFLSRHGVLRNVGAGAVLGVVSAAVYLGLRGEVGKLPGVLEGVFEPKNVKNFVPVFLEGVGVAFLFVRLRWVIGHWPALAIPGILFAAAHIPRQLAASSSPGTMIAFFVLNTLLLPAILHVTALSRNIVWIGIVHYIMDIATRAFE